MNRLHAQWTSFGIVIALLLAAGGYTIGKWNSDQGKVPEEVITPDGKGELPEQDAVPAELAGEPRTVGDITFEIEEMNEARLLTPYKEAMIKGYQKSYGTFGDTVPLSASDNPTWNAMLVRMKWFEVGEFTGEESPFKGQKLFLLVNECDGPCFYPPLYRFAYDMQTDNLTFFKNISTEWMDESLKPLTQNSSNAILQEVALPQTIALPEGKKGTLIRAFRNDFTDRSFGTAADLGYGKVVFTDPTYGPVYGKVELEAGEKVPSYYSSAMYVQAPDGTFGSYEVQGIDFNDTLVNAPQNIQLPEYRFLSQGCGIVGNAYSIEPVILDQLVLLGTTVKGYTLYEVKNPDERAMIRDPQNDYNILPQAGYNNAQIELATLYLTKKMFNENAEFEAQFKTWPEFLAVHPLLYFKDAFGRFGAIAHNDFAPTAECGKPVIYLYPQEEMEVSVQVDVDEFTKTVPEYGENGWKVRATPKGKLTNLADGQTYPYLFWEAKDDDGVNADQGFMVERKKVDRFLKKSLKTMGFTRKEMKDFMEFWKPRILDNPEPYFFISFIGTQDFNKVAPLTITPTPDTLIRVFMYYQPLNTPMSVVEQRLSATPRRGFTVFEWGGTSSVPWKDEE